MNAYVLATVKSWNIQKFHDIKKNMPGSWHLIDSPDTLNIELLEKIKPRYIFFPHWSWIVPGEITKNYECICFHMTDVPYGRGGSPLQNLILRGHHTTKVTALRMVDELDAGPVYLKNDLDLSGRAQDIFERATYILYDMINYIVRNEPEPVPQEGKPIIFKRRTPEMSLLPDNDEICKLYDHIRMLDAESYPHAFINYGRFHLTFTHAELDDGDSLTAKVCITSRDIEE